MFLLLGGLWIGFGAFVFLGLELFFGLIQALIFAILTLVYITSAVAGQGGEAHEGAEAHEPAPGSLEALGVEVAGKITGSREGHQSTTNLTIGGRFVNHIDVLGLILQQVQTKDTVNLL